MGLNGAQHIFPKTSVFSHTVDSSLGPTRIFLFCTIILSKKKRYTPDANELKKNVKKKRLKQEGGTRRDSFW